MNDDRYKMAPETHNSEQDDEPGQAQTVAEDALKPRLTGTDGGSVKARRGGGDDVAGAQDLIDHMRDMERSGRIDMSAYRGEPNMDDEDETYGDPKTRDDED